jgi:preprotein translocase subunit SecG
MQNQTDLTPVLLIIILMSFGQDCSGAAASKLLGKMEGQTAGATTEEMLMQQVATQLTASFYRTALTLANDEHDCVCELAAVTL